MRAGLGGLSTASYEARACGVRTAMPISQAQRLCPQATFLPVDMPAYAEAHEKLVELFGRFTDLVEPVSIDEAFLDVTGSRRLFSSPQEIARRVQEFTYAELRWLAASQGASQRPAGAADSPYDDGCGHRRGGTAVLTTRGRPATL
ncbi:MAG TPA: hypothetical protein VIK32_11050 [Candidatus Limnocylindrales bacterium]